MDVKKIKIDKINWYVVCLVLCSLVIIFSLVGRRSFNKTYDAYVEASLSFDGDAVYDLLHESYIDECIRNQYDSSNTGFLLKNTRAYYENLKNYVDEDSVRNNRYIAECTLIEDRDLDNDIYHLTVLYGDNVDKIQAAKKVSVRFIEQKSDGTSEIVYTDYYFYFVKINHRWYLGELPFMP